MNDIFIGAVLSISFILYIFFIFFTTCYIVEKDTLIIKAGYFYSQEILLNKIRKISEVYDFSTAAASSFDRLELLIDKFDRILISPKDKVSFIEQIRKHNPEIEICKRK